MSRRSGKTPIGHPPITPKPAPALARKAVRGAPGIIARGRGTPRHAPARPGARRRASAEARTSRPREPAPAPPNRPEGPCMTFQPVESYTRVRLSDVVSDQIKSLISAGKLLPGQKLPTERELAAQLNVSRPSLREALVRLEADGFIGSVGRGGFVVSDITAPVVSSPLADLLLQNPEASHDVLELRHGLETISTAYAAERATPGDLAKIKEAFDTLAGHSLKHEPGRLAEVDANFHLAIADATHNVALIHVMHGIHGLLQESMHKSHRLVNHADAMERALLEQHTEIYEAIAAKDPERARAAAERHLRYVRALYEQAA
ncbi:transcriptional regulator, GntR family [Burkholderia mallei PRL-20]|nr:transcriptional regulator, GntR family [Burkholderia mallei PRL-20]